MQQSMSPSAPRHRLREVAGLFTRLGFTAFGGPAAHVAMMEDEVVRRRGWLDRQHFLDLMAAVNFVPGPNSTEMAIHLGLIRAGYAGLVTAGVCFILPAVLIILPLGWMYVTFGQVPQVQGVLRGINACVIAIIAAALWRFARTGVKDGFTGGIAIVATMTGFLAEPEVWRWLEAHAGWLGGLGGVLAGASSALIHHQPELLILALSAAAGALYYGRPRIENLTALPMLLPVPLPLLATVDLGEMGRMALFFLKVGATLFGSGYVLVSYLQGGLVDQHGWLTKQQLLDAVAVGQVTPGPLLTTATFIGFVLGYGKFGGGLPGGVVGAFVATAAIFFPAFCFIAILGPLLPRIRRNRFARGALDGMNAAVVALIFVVAVRLGVSAFGAAPGMNLLAAGPVDVGGLLVAGISLYVMLKWDVNSTWLVLAAGGIGLVRAVL